jgi:probable HAF family extracellular repeat protein
MLPVMISPAKSCPDKPAVNVGGQFVDSGGTVQNLNTLIPAGSGYQIQSATGINDNGHIVANATDTATGQTHALLLTPS